MRIRLLAGMAPVLVLLFQQAVSRDDFVLRYRNDQHRLQSVQRGSKDYFRLDQISTALGLSFQLDEDRLILTGPRAALSIQENRPLVQSQQSYVLLSGPVERDPDGNWLVPRDFLENALSLILDSRIQVGSLAPGGDQARVSVQVLNSANRVSLIFLPSATLAMTTRDENDTIEIEFDSPVQFVEPGVRPEVSLVAALRCQSLEASAQCSLTKGFDFRSYQASILTQPRRLIVNVLSMATDVVGDPLEILEDPEIAEAPLLPVVTIDAGHGGEDRGITSGTLLEKDVVRQISMLLKGSLQKIRLEADPTRSSDFNPSLSLRSSVANTNQSIVFVSLHLGGSHTPDVRGPVVYTHEAAETEPPPRRSRSEELTPWYAAQQPHLKQSRRLAELIQGRLNTLFGTSNSSESAPLEVLAPVQAPAVLIEAGFLTNPEDARLLEDPAFQESIAQSIADAIRVFLR